MEPNLKFIDILIKNVEALSQDRDRAWENVHTLEKAKQEQDKKLTDLQSRYTQLFQYKAYLKRRLVSAKALIKTLQEQSK